MENQDESQDLSQSSSDVADNNPLYAQAMEKQQSVAPPVAAQPVVENVAPVVLVAPAAPEVPQAQVKFAGFWIRLVASIIDCLVLIIPQAIIGGVITMASFGVMQKIATNMASLLVTWVYYVFMTNAYQATLGKKALGIRVFSTRPENLTLNQVILRETIGKLVSMLTFFIGYIMAGFTQKKQALHDLIAGTVVIYNNPKK